MSLSELISRLEKATEGSRELIEALGPDIEDWDWLKISGLTLRKTKAALSALSAENAALAIQLADETMAHKTLEEMWRKRAADDESTIAVLRAAEKEKEKPNGR